MSFISTISNGRVTYDQQTIPSSPNVGDIWTERDSSNKVIEQWFWNGTYWLSINNIYTQFNVQAGNLATISSNNSAPYLPIYQNNDINLFIISVDLQLRINNGASSASNYWTVQPETLQLPNTYTNLGASKNTYSDMALPANSYTLYRYSFYLNLLINTYNGVLQDIRFQTIQTGSPGSLIFSSATVNWRKARQ